MLNHNNISRVKYCDNIMESLGDSHLYCWWSVVREWTEELLIMGCGVISGLHCIPDWNGGVWAAGVETSHGGFQQVQVSFNITALCFLFFNSSFNNGRFSCLFVFLSLFFFKTTNKYFCLVRTIYEKLASAFTEDLAVLYRQRVDEISPNIRYCAYNIGQHCCSRSSQCHCWCTTPILSSVLPLHTDKHTLTPWLYLILGDQNAINDLMQMRLTGGGGGMMAEKLEVNTKG